MPIEYKRVVNHEKGEAGLFIFSEDLKEIKL
jgi:hypothetical protein